MGSATVDVLIEVAAERERQDLKWGVQNHPDGTGRLACTMFSMPKANRLRQWCDDAHKAGRGTWAHIALEEMAEALEESDPAKLRAELIQSIAVQVAWVEAIDRRTA